MGILPLRCRRNPDAYIGVPYKQLLEGGGADAGEPSSEHIVHWLLERTSSG